MALTEVNDVASTQTASGQPAGATSHDATETVETNNDANVQQNDSATETQGGEQQTTDATATQTAEGGATAQAAAVKVDIDIPPEALRQITNLSSANRQFRKKIAELEAKITSTTPPTDLEAKLARLGELEAALTSPRKFLALSKKTLEDVAADVLASDTEAVDPRVDALSPAVEAIKKEIQDLKQSLTSKDTSAAETANATRMMEATKHVQTIIEANPARWEFLADDKTAAAAALEAATIVVKTKYTDSKTGRVQDISRELSTRILEECLDEAEAIAVARQVVADRKNNPGHSAQIPVRKKGLEVREVEQGSKLPPKPTMGDDRGPTRSLRVPRGPTDVRTARARALAIAEGKNE